MRDERHCAVWWLSSPAEESGADVISVRVRSGLVRTAVSSLQQAAGDVDNQEQETKTPRTTGASSDATSTYPPPYNSTFHKNMYVGHLPSLLVNKICVSRTQTLSATSQENLQKPPSAGPQLRHQIRFLFES